MLWCVCVCVSACFYLSGGWGGEYLKVLTLQGTLLILTMTHWLFFFTWKTFIEKNSTCRVSFAIVLCPALSYTSMKCNFFLSICLFQIKEGFATNYCRLTSEYKQVSRNPKLWIWEFAVISAFKTQSFFPFYFIQFCIASHATLCHFLFLFTSVLSFPPFFSPLSSKERWMRWIFSLSEGKAAWSCLDSSASLHTRNRCALTRRSLAEAWLQELWLTQILLFSFFFLLISQCMITVKAFLPACTACERRLVYSSLTHHSLLL